MNFHCDIKSHRKINLKRGILTKKEHKVASRERIDKSNTKSFRFVSSAYLEQCLFVHEHSFA